MIREKRGRKKKDTGRKMKMTRYGTEESKRWKRKKKREKKRRKGKTTALIGRKMKRSIQNGRGENKRKSK